MWCEVISKMPIYYMNSDSALINSSNLRLLEHIIGTNPGQLNSDLMKSSLLVKQA
jgi:hypothetical protein